MIWGLFLLFASTPRDEREDCGLDTNECYGLEELLHCALGPGLRFCFGIEEVGPPPQPGIEVYVYAPCDTDAKAWAEPRIASIAKLSPLPVVNTVYMPCDTKKPRVDAMLTN